MMPLKRRQVTQVMTSFRIQTELLKKLEKVPDLNEAPFDPDSFISGTKDVKLLWNGLTRMLATYMTTYMDMVEIFDWNLTEMEDGKARDEKEVLA